MQSGLYIVGSPIGNLSDISERAINTLKNVDLIACEDTRVFSKLASVFDIKTKKISFYNYNERNNIEKIINYIKDGLKIAIVSDSGMPCINDPGFRLVRECRKEKLYITVIPGASAVISALVLSGFATDKFTFCGFFDEKKFQDEKNISNTIIYYESPNRVLNTLTIFDEFIPHRKIALVREISKIYEETIIGYPHELLTKCNVKGECVLVIDKEDTKKIKEEDLDKIIDNIKNFSIKEIADIISKILSIPKKEVYAKIIQKIKND